MNEVFERVCSVCGKTITGDSVYHVVHKMLSHCYCIHKLTKKQVPISSEDLSEYTPKYKISVKEENLKRREKNRLRGMIDRRRPEFIGESNNRLLEKIGEEQYKTYPVCAICGFVNKTLYMHVTKIHEMTTAEYEEKHPGHSLAESGYLLELSKRSIGEKNAMHGKSIPENSPFSVEFYLKKGHTLEEAEKLKDDLVNKIKETRVVSTTVGYYENKFGVDTLTAKEMLKERQSTNRVDVIAKRNNISIGEAQALRDEITKKWVGTLNKKSDEEWANINQKKVGKSISGASMKFFDKLVEYCGIKKEECLYGEEREVSICRNEEFTDMEMKKYFLYDFTYNNKMIEFNGDFYHANPIKYAPDDKPFERISAMAKQSHWTAEQVWNFDTYKNKVATDHGYEMLVIWEYDAKHHLRESLEKAKEYLLGDKNV